MSHTYEYGTTKFICNSDKSGPITIVNENGDSIDIECFDAIKAFAYSDLREEIIRSVESSTHRELFKFVNIIERK